jgi:multiple sugar transport system permease protein
MEQNTGLSGARATKIQVFGLEMDWRTWRDVRYALRKTVAYSLTTLLALVFSIPFFWMVLSSLKTSQELAQLPPTLIPRIVAWWNYPEAWTAAPFGLFIRNSTVYVGLAVVGELLSSSLVGYSFARLQWRGRDFFFVLMLMTMMLPGQVTMIPQYILFRELRWLDSLRPLIIPSFFGSAMYIFLVRQFFRAIPIEMDEAALLDGASRLTIFLRIILPLARPILTAVVAFSFIAHWNNFMGPLIYVNTQRKLPVAVGLLYFRGTAEMGHSAHLAMAASVMALAPVVIVFFSAQRYFVTSITLTGMKG